MQPLALRIEMAFFWLNPNGCHVCALYSVWNGLKIALFRTGRPGAISRYSALAIWPRLMPVTMAWRMYG